MALNPQRGGDRPSPVFPPKYGAPGPAAIRRVLLDEWDPMGVRDDPERQDAYDGYALAIYGLLARGADVNHVPAWEQLTPLDAAARSSAHEVLKWLHSRGARTAAQLSAR